MGDPASTSAGQAHGPPDILSLPGTHGEGERGLLPSRSWGNKAVHALLRTATLPRLPPSPSEGLRRSWGGVQGASPDRWVCGEGRASAGWLCAAQREPVTLSPLLSAIGSPLPTTVKCNTSKKVR